MATELGGSAFDRRSRRTAYSRAVMPGVTESCQFFMRESLSERCGSSTFACLQQMRVCLVQWLAELELARRDEGAAGRRVTTQQPR